jgi:DNA-binding SARP family transcriptional activator/tetratricopeptide (TPR) repeat protein
MPGRILRLNLLGGFSLAYGDQAIASVNTVRLQSLLAYLVLHANTPQPRQHVAFLLWPDTSESNARNNLRQFLHQLRQALPDPDRFLVITPQTLCWQTDADQIIDVQRFEHALTEAAAAEQHADESSTRQWLKEALSIYQGDLLPDCYDDWITPERDRVRQQCLAAHQKLVHLLEQQRDYAAALQVAQASLRLDPLDESTYVTLMRLHDLNRDRPAARRVYLTAVETLRRELDVEPGEGLRQAYERVQRAPETRHPDQAASSVKLVGRQIEWQHLHSAWQRAADGDAHLVLITGEAGIGKSRLAEELFRWAEQQSFTVAQTRSYAAEGRLSFAPVTDWLRSAALRPHVNTLDHVWLTEIARLLPELLSEHADLTRPEPITEYGQRQRFFEALARAILAAPQPLLLWIDDLQWCDPDTLEWLHFLLRFRPRYALLVLGTARSEESPSDHPLANLARQLRAENKLTSIELASLDASETARLASQIQGHELTVAASMRLYHETEGNPLFVVETVRASTGNAFGAGVSETAGTEQHSHVLPPRVYAVIARRLAQLSPAARRIAELGAAIGRAFTFAVLQQAGQDDEDNIVQALDELWQKRIVREQSVNMFDFTHDKLREVAYAEISAQRRRLLHRHIAQALEGLNADNLDAVSAQIGAHYEQAAMLERALPYYQRAGVVAASVYANDDAIHLLTRGLALLAQLPPSEKRDVQELAFLLTLAPLYRITQGWAAQDTERVANRARVLSATIGSVAQQVQALWLQQTVDVVAARFERVLQTNAEMQRLLKVPGAIPLPFIEVHFAGARFFMGQFATANELFEQMLAGRAENYAPDFRLSHGVNYWAHSLVWNSHAIWCLGYPHKALKTCEEGIRVAREFFQPFNHALAITYLATLQEWCADAVTFQATARAAEALSREFDVQYYRSWATILLDFAQAVTQPGDDNLVHLQDSIRAFKETGSRIRLPYYWSLLARAYHHAGQIDQACTALDEAFGESRQQEECWWDAELWRLRGELIWAQGAEANEVEAAFRRAIEIAQSQQAKSLELRAATSLARLWQAAGRSDAARQLLVPLYGWFTEGFDTPDLQAAQSLIAQL